MSKLIHLIFSLLLVFLNCHFFSFISIHQTKSPRSQLPVWFLINQGVQAPGPRTPSPVSFSLLSLLSVTSSLYHPCPPFSCLAPSHLYFMILKGTNHSPFVGFVSYEEAVEAVAAVLVVVLCRLLCLYLRHFLSSCRHVEYNEPVSSFLHAVCILDFLKLVDLQFLSNLIFPLLHF